MGSTALAGFAPAAWMAAGAVLTLVAAAALRWARDRRLARLAAEWDPY